MSKSTKMVFRAIGTFSTPLKYAILVCLQVIKKIGRLDFCVWLKRIVNHITSWSDIFIPVYLLDRALVTWFIIVDDGFQSTLGQVTLVIRNRSAILYLWVLQAIEDIFLSSNSFIFVAQISHAGFPTVGLSSKCGLRRGVVFSQANISRSGPLVQVTLH